MPKKRPIRLRREEYWSRPEMAEVILKRRRELGEYLRLLRRSLGMTREEAAEKIGIHPIQLARVESASANFTISTLLSMSIAYGTPVEEIFQHKMPAKVPRRRNGSRTV